MKSRSTNRSGIVLRRRVTPAGDIIVTLLTPQGKLGAIARSGVRGPHASRLNLFHHVGVQLYQTPQADLGTVQQSVLEGALPTLCQPGRHPYAHLLSELADALFQEGEFSQAAFELYAASLRGVAHHADPEWVALVMAYKLLALAGFAPRTDRCARCGAPEPAYPDLLGGQLLCGGCANQAAHPPERLEFLRFACKRSVRALMDAPLLPQQRPVVWQMLERYVTLQIGTVRSWQAALSAAQEISQRANQGVAAVSA